MESIIVGQLTKLLDVNTPIVFINDFDFARVDVIISLAIGDAAVYEWNPATGRTDFKTKEQLLPNFEGLEDFLKSFYDDAFKMPRYLILKEVSGYIEEPRVRALLQMISQRKLYDRRYETSIIIVASENHIPEDVSKYVSYLEIDYPTDSEIKDIIYHHVKINGDHAFDDSTIETLIVSLKGMSRFDIDRVIDMAMSSNGTLRVEDTEMILAQKKQMVKKSGTIELIDAPESLEDIGGLDYLKEYLKKKSIIFKNPAKASAFGVAKPKGVFLVGMPGCGKSLCSKAAGKIFDAPLLKLDMGSLMGKYVGESEENMRKAIRIAEAAAPCVLWIDEIEKAFSGVGGGNTEILTRMFGYFLTWLQDKKSSVYVIATANKAKDLPPELMRKGRFDEIFCINLPTSSERESIFSAHIKKIMSKECYSGENQINYEELASATDGFNGADIESVVNQTIENIFLQNIEKNTKEKLTTESLHKECMRTLSISKSCKSQIDDMEEIFKKGGFRNATTGEIVESSKKRK